MLITRKLNDALNEQIAIEFFADLQYLAVSVYFDGRGLSNLAKFFAAQAGEEREHALKIIHYVLEAGGQVIIPAVSQPQNSFGSVLEIARLFVDQEHSVTMSFHRMVEMAMEEKDYTTLNFLQWFVAEQLEEESTAGRVLQVVQMAGEERLFQVELMAGQWE